MRKKQNRTVIWTAYSRRKKCVIDFVIGEGIKACHEIYRKVKELRRNIEIICTDGNSCYESLFKKLNIRERHVIDKAQTHLIESSNSSLRDQLARMKRKTKAYSKSIDMLKISLELHFYRHTISMP